MDRVYWLQGAESIENNLYDLTDQDDFEYDQEAIDQKLRWAWQLRRQAIAYDRSQKEGLSSYHRSQLHSPEDVHLNLGDPASLLPFP